MPKYKKGRLALWLIFLLTVNMLSIKSYEGMVENSVFTNSVN